MYQIDAVTYRNTFSHFTSVRPYKGFKGTKGNSDWLGVFQAVQ